MTFIELFNESRTTLVVNRLRTSLAILGIVIGIGSVIALISLGQSSQKSVANQIQSLGANLLTVNPGSQNNGGVRSAAGSSTTLTLADAQAIQAATIATINQVSPEYSNRAQITAGGTNTNAQVTGVMPQYATVHKVGVETGVFISQTDEESLAKVAVIGPQVAVDLFGETGTALGQTVRVNGQLLRVIGVTTAKGGNGFQNPDNSIYVPLSTALKILFNASHLTAIAIEAKDQNVMTQTQNEVGYLLLERHNLSDPTQADFSILSQNDILSTVNQVTGTFTTMLGGVAAISLLVGGIGIMNIMLVTVTERTREIGLRQALGAKKKLIIQQFLMEAVLLTVIGGTVGMVFGLGVSFVLAQVLKLPFVIDPSSIVLAIGVSALIGIVFGWYPAQQAAKLQPIEALRYE